MATRQAKATSQVSYSERAPANLVVFSLQIIHQEQSYAN